MNRRLAVPLAVDGVVSKDHDRFFRRILKDEENPEDLEIMRKLAENRDLIDSILADIENDPVAVDTHDISNELDYIKASVQLGLLEITGELEATPYSDELFEEAAA